MNGFKRLWRWIRGNMTNYKAIAEHKNIQVLKSCAFHQIIGEFSEALQPRHIYFIILPRRQNKL